MKFSTNKLQGISSIVKKLVSHCQSSQFRPPLYARRLCRRTRANSNVNFSVTKVQYVIEPAEFKKVGGTVIVLHAGHTLDYRILATGEPPIPLDDEKSLLKQGWKGLCQDYPRRIRGHIGANHQAQGDPRFNRLHRLLARLQQAGRV